jgi:hypothetical protein
MKGEVSREMIIKRRREKPEKEENLKDREVDKKMSLKREKDKGKAKNRYKKRKE